MDADIRSYRARSLQEALQLVRRDLGPDASVLETREIGSTWLGWLGTTRQVEVTASVDVTVPSRFRTSDSSPPAEAASESLSRSDPPPPSIVPAHLEDHRERLREQLDGPINQGRSLVEELAHHGPTPAVDEISPVAYELFQQLVDAEVPDAIARQLIRELHHEVAPRDWHDRMLLTARLVRLVENQLPCHGPLTVQPGYRRVIAFVGPTGVGKTTTIAKLAAHYRLRRHCRVGLVTVDTYRIAAVDQLRTYADIIDLPMEVVSAPNDMRLALNRLDNVDLVLMDTAGRSPRDEVRIHELRALLQAAQVDEVHLVLGSVASLAALTGAARQFAKVGLTSVVLTKVDEASRLGGLLALARECKLPISYITNGQNVPEDISVAESRRLAHWILGLSPSAVETARGETISVHQM